MGRGILFGALWGFILGGIVLAVASLLGEVPGRSAPQASQLEVPAGSGFDQAGVDVPVAPPAIQPPAEPQSSAPLVTAPEAPVAPSLSGDVTSSASVPQTGGAEGLATPPAGASDSGVVLRTETAPSGDTNTGISTPTAEPAPETSSEPAAPIEVPEPEPEPAPEPEPQPEPEPEPAPEPEAAEVERAEAPTEEVPETPAVPAAEETPAAEEPVEVTEAPVAEAPAEEAVEEEPVTEAAPDVAETAAAPRPQANAGGFGNRASGVTVNRLTDSQQGAEEAEIAAEEEPQDPRAIIRNAMTDGWDGPDDRPLLSFILIDEAGDAGLLSALGSFDGPLTFALPATASEATRNRYRDAGHEIVVIADLPEAAQPSDIEVAMESTLISVPEAVAVLDGSLSGFRGDRNVAGQVVEILSDSGHGMVTVAQGLDAASQIASREGVPSGTIYRDLDDADQNNSVIRRFLDQAAFRAQQEGKVILLGRLKPETISALLIWRQQARANRVNLAPLSATLLAE